MSQSALSPTHALPAVCPVIKEARRALSASRNLSSMLRRLQRSRRKCRGCPLAASGLPGTDCPAWQEFNRLVEQAITEINREWEML